jgi:uroporphyrinogen III methyltransferase / synthase
MKTRRDLTRAQARHRRVPAASKETTGHMPRMTEATEMRPLQGRTIVITRAAAQAQRFVDLLEAQGARVLAAPTIAIEPPPSWQPLDAALEAIDSFAWVVFTSVNGVTMVDRRLTARRMPWTTIGRRRVAAIGPATSEALAEHGVRADVVPGEFRAEGLIARLRHEVRPGDKVLLPRAAQTRDILVTELRKPGVSSAMPGGCAPRSRRARCTP